MSARHRVLVTRLHIRRRRADYMSAGWQLGVGLAVGVLLGVLVLV